MADTLSKRTWIFGLSVWIIAGIVIGAAIVLILFVVSLWFICNRQKDPTDLRADTAKSDIYNKPTASISSIIPDDPIRIQFRSNPFSSAGKRDVPAEGQAVLVLRGRGECKKEVVAGESRDAGAPRRSGVSVGPPAVSHLGWGHWYTLRELEQATNGFADGNVIGEGGYGIVYYGLLEDNTQIAVKNLLNNRGQAEKEFKVEVEAIGRVRHKCLVRLIGYCAEGADRMLVYEYVNNGNLEQWLHGEVGPYSPLTWDIRMKIILGTAKGLTYLHEGLDPKVVHRDIKSSNILLDKKWNPKVSDFGLAKLLGSDDSYITTRVMGTYGYVAPEYASTGMLTERSDVYSFGILVMEIISGRDPVDCSKPPGEVNLVDWFRATIASKNPEGVLDPKMQEKPNTRSLKVVLLIALRCVDPNALKRPKMGQVVHMLEAEDPSFRDERRTGTNHGSRQQV